MLTPSPFQQARQDLDSVKCGACGNAKVKRQAFCKVCYFKLDKDLRQQLYKSFNCGYEEAYIEAKDWLLAEARAKGK